MRRKYLQNYQDLSQKVERNLACQLSILQNQVDRYASKNSKKSFKCEVLHLNEITIRKLSDFYHMDAPVEEYLCSMLKQNKTSLAKMVNQAYEQLYEDKARWN
jgi:hypothetical protein